jgi:hypothetical protein
MRFRIFVVFIVGSSFQHMAVDEVAVHSVNGSVPVGKLALSLVQ